MEFIETSIFTREVEKLLSDDEYQALQNILVLDPEAGVLIRGGKGKSGGARVIYDFKVAADQIYMLAVYAKGRKENLSAEETAQLRELVKRL